MGLLQHPELRGLRAARAGHAQGLARLLFAADRRHAVLSRGGGPVPGEPQLRRGSVRQLVGSPESRERDPARLPEVPGSPSAEVRGRVRDEPPSGRRSALRHGEGIRGLPRGPGPREAATVHRGELRRRLGPGRRHGQHRLLQPPEEWIQLHEAIRRDHRGSLPDARGGAEGGRRGARLGTPAGRRHLLEGPEGRDPESGRHRQPDDLAGAPDHERAVRGRGTSSDARPGHRGALRRQSPAQLPARILDRNQRPREQVRPVLRPEVGPDESLRQAPPRGGRERGQLRRAGQRDLLGFSRRRPPDLRRRLPARLPRRGVPRGSTRSWTREGRSSSSETTRRRWSSTCTSRRRISRS